jgi:GNAT superfamily N-acetyltransferase
MIVRPAGPTDAVRIVEMSDRFLRTTQYGAVTPWTLESLGRLVAAVLEHGVILVAATPAADLVGMIALYPQYHPISGERFCDELVWWVEPEHRHGSVGPRLLAAAEAWALEHELRVLKMVAPADAPEVGAFLQRRGYAFVETLYQKRL